MSGTRPLVVGVELGGGGRHRGAAPAGPAAVALAGAPAHVVRVRAAAHAGLDLIVLPDTFAAPDPSAPGGDVPVLDAVMLAARLAPLVPGTGLVPTVTTTHTEPFHLSKAVATLDLVSGGWGGVEFTPSRTAAEAALFGRRAAAAPAALWREVGQVCDVTARLWDSWEDDAVVRDAATGRYVDRDRLHHVEFTGEFFTVKGPSITPRPPQGHPLVVLRADEPEAVAVAAAWADVVRVSAADLDAAGAARDRVRAAVAAAGRDPDTVLVLLDVEVHLAGDRSRARRELAAFDAVVDHPSSSLRVAGPVDDLVETVASLQRGGAADGVVLVPLALPADLHLTELTTRLACVGRPVRPPGTGGDLRARLGLPRSDNQYVAAGAQTVARKAARKAAQTVAQEASTR